MTWLKELDDLLRGRKTSREALAQGTDHLRLGPYTSAGVLLAAVYGVFMGLYAVINISLPVWDQWLAAAVKTPFLFLFTLVVTFPSLYVFSALMGTPLTLRGTLRLVVAAQAVMIAVLASLGPIVGFFALTTGSYPFIKLLNILFFAVAGIIGLGFLVKMLRRLEELQESEEPPVLDLPPAAGERREAAEAPQPTALPYARPVAPLVQRLQHDRSRGGQSAWTVFRVWILIYAVVGAQMAWIMRPFIGDPKAPFQWFCPRESNFLADVLNTISKLTSS